MTQKDIERALGSRLEEYKVAYPINIAYPSVSYDPVIGTSFIQVDVLHGETAQVELGSSSDDRAVGVYQLTVNTKNNQGMMEVSTIIGQLHEYFKRGTSIILDDVKVRITQFSVGSNDSAGDWYREVINIVFRSDITN